MERPLKERLTGAVVLVVAAVILIPMVLSGPPDAPQDDAGAARSRAARSDDTPPSQSTFASRVVPLGGEPAAPVREPAPAPRALAQDAIAPAPAKSPPAPRPRRVEPPARSAPRPSPRPEAKAEPAVRAGWVVQLGSFSEHRNAVALRDKLAAKGYSAFVEISATGSGKVTRVFVGPEAQRQRAERTRGQLLKETKLKGIVVRREGR